MRNGFEFSDGTQQKELQQKEGEGEVDQEEGQKFLCGHFKVPLGLPSRHHLLSGA